MPVSSSTSDRCCRHRGTARRSRRAPGCRRSPRRMPGPLVGRAPARRARGGASDPAPLGRAVGAPGEGGQAGARRAAPAPTGARPGCARRTPGPGRGRGAARLGGGEGCVDRSWRQRPTVPCPGRSAVQPRTRPASRCRDGLRVASARPRPGSPSAGAMASKASRSQASSGPSSRTGRPMPSSTTNRSRAPRDFLSRRITASRASNEPAGVRRGQPHRRQHRPVPRHDVAAERCPERSAELGGVRHADRHRLPVPPAVPLDLLDGVPQGVPVVEDLAQPRLGEVLRDDLGLDRDRPLDQLAGVRAVPPGRAGRVGLDEVEDHRVGDEARP